MNWKRTVRMFRRFFKARRARVREQYGPPHSWRARKLALEAELRAAGGDVIFEPYAHDHQILLRVRGHVALIDLRAGEAYLFPEPRLTFEPPKLEIYKPDADAALRSYAQWMGFA